MWDVKSLNHDFLGVGEWGFTLTMWDVKCSISPESRKSERTFYLNYVGCKGLLTKLK